MTLRARADRLIAALVRGEEFTIEAGSPEEAAELVEATRERIAELGDELELTGNAFVGPGLTDEELERARALLEVEPVRSPRGARTDGLVPDTVHTDELAHVGADELEAVIEAVPLANGGPCEGDKCRRSSKGRRRAIWAILDKRLCDRCATRFAKALDTGGPKMAIPKGRR